MSTPKKPTLRFPGKPQIRLRAEIDVISGLLIRAYHLAYTPLINAAYHTRSKSPWVNFGGL